MADLAFLLKETGPGLSRSHLISAVELGCLDTVCLAFFLSSFFLLPVFFYFPTEKFRTRIA